MSRNDAIYYCKIIYYEVTDVMGDRHRHLGRRHVRDFVFVVVSCIGFHCVCGTTSINAHH